MSKILITLLILISTIACSNTKSNDDKYVLKAVQYEELESIVNMEDNILYVVNFWATWCKPCVDEMPDFMEVNELYKKNDKFKMILVSLDDVDVLNKDVANFIEKYHIKADVYLLDDIKRMNMWIPATDPSWSGAIPATVFIRNGEKLHFHEGQLHKDELIEIINHNL